MKLYLKINSTNPSYAFSLSMLFLEQLVVIFYDIGGVILANIKSAKKRILVNAKRAARNKAIRSKVKTMIKKVEAAVAAQDKELAKQALTVAVSEIDKARSKGVIHKNSAARKISRLTKKVNSLS
jgi:small subunit ribosomal protein S20